MDVWLWQTNPPTCIQFSWTYQPTQKSDVIYGWPQSQKNTMLPIWYFLKARYIDITISTIQSVRSCDHACFCTSVTSQHFITLIAPEFVIHVWLFLHSIDITISTFPSIHLCHHASIHTSVTNWCFIGFIGPDALSTWCYCYDIPAKRVLHVCSLVQACMWFC